MEGRIADFVASSVVAAAVADFVASSSAAVVAAADGTDASFAAVDFVASPSFAAAGGLVDADKVDILLALVDT